MRELTLSLDEVTTLQNGFPVVVRDGAAVLMQVLPLAAVVSGNPARSNAAAGIGEDDQLVLDWNQLVVLRGGGCFEVRTRAAEPIVVSGPNNS